MPTATPFNNLITFSRGSNATVTGSNGLIQYAPNNVLLQSESFDATAWTKVLSASVTANTDTAPDGTITADTVIAGATNSAVRQTVTTQADSYTFSCWIKRKTGTGNVEISATGGLWVTQSLTTSWQRFSVTQSLSAGSNFPGVRITTSGDEVYVWGAQLELGSTATTYNPTTVKNLLGFSEAFDNAGWNKGNSSIVTGAQANPVNGLFNAQKLMENTVTGVHRVQQGFTTVTGATHTFSCYAKAAERSWVYLYDDAANGFAYFNLANGTVGTVGAGWTSTSITPVGSGWYRISGTTTEASGGAGAQQIGLATANGTASYTGDGNSGVYIYGAQLSDSASLDPYVPTPGAAPSSTAFYGPRFDFDPVTRAPRGLLVEEQRTNLVLYSDDFANAAWTKENATATANATAAPDGATTADRLNASAGVGVHSTYTATAITVATGTNATSTIYVKKGTHRFVYLTQSVSVAHNFTAIFDLDGGGSTATQTGVGSLSGTIASTSQTDVGNGWFRLSVTGSATGASRFVAVGFAQAATGNTIDNVGNVTYTAAGTETIFIWGAQLEAGAFATSYIPTVASTVTRSADVATISGQNFAQWYGQTAGTFVVDADTGSTNTFAYIYAASEGGPGNNEISTRKDGATWRAIATVGGASSANLTLSTAVAGAPVIIGYAYAANNFAASSNGETVVTDTSGNLPTVDQLVLGTQRASSPSNFTLNGHIRNIRFIPARAADFQLQGLST